MKKVLLALFVLTLLAPAVTAAGSGDLTAPIRQAIDGFNHGDVKSFLAAYAKDDITIVDEFAPHIWRGVRAPQDWADEYERQAKATGVSDGVVSYGEPTRTEVEDDVAYVILPTVYAYKERGKALVEEGQMTFVMNRESGGWKIRGWTWSSVKPHAAK